MLGHQHVRSVTFSTDGDRLAAQGTHGNRGVKQVTFGALVTVREGEVLRAELLFAGRAFGGQKVQLVARFDGAVNAELGKLHFGDVQGIRDQEQLNPHRTKMNH